MNRRGVVILAGVGCIVAVVAWLWLLPSPNESSQQPRAVSTAAAAGRGAVLLNNEGGKSKTDPAEKSLGRGVKAEGQSEAQTSSALTGNPATMPRGQTASGRASMTPLGNLPRGAISPQLDPQTSARSSAERSSALFFEAVNVDASSREKLIRLEADHSLEFRDITEVSRARGLSGAEINKLREDAFKNYREKVAEVLGPEQGNYFIALADSAMFGPIVEDFADRCAAKGEPLGPSAMAATRINLAENLRPPFSSSARPSVLNSEGIPREQDRAFKSAAKVLTPGQMEVFKQLWSEHPYPKPGDMPSR